MYFSNMWPRNRVTSAPSARLSRTSRSSSHSRASGDEKRGDKRQIRTIEDVTAWLRRIKQDEYASSFLENEIDGDILKTLTSEELRDDLNVTNLRNRREILHAIMEISQQEEEIEGLPEHGRILDHLSNVRTYHSWIRVGVQFLAFSIVTLRLAPTFRDTILVSVASFYYALVGVLALVYGILRYKTVINMIETSGPSKQQYRPDRIGVACMLVCVIIACIISLVIISLHTKQ